MAARYRFWPVLAGFCLFPFAIKAQSDCSKLVPESKKLNGVQLTRSVAATFIVRGSYSYTVEFFTDEKGVFARITSIGGVDFNQDDQFVFIDANGSEKAYKFITLAEEIPGSTPTHRNTLHLDIPALEWLAGNTVTNVTIINFVDRQKYKFQVSPNRQVEFRQLANCFLSAVDKSAVVVSAASSVEKPGHGGPKPAATTGGSTGGGSQEFSTVGTTSNTGGNKQNQDTEVTSLRNELETIKKQLRDEIQAERDKAAAIKAQLQAEVVAANEAATAKKAQFANEVLEARKQSQAEIEKNKEENAKFLAESKQKAGVEADKINQSVEAARRTAGEEIQKAKLASADEVAKARDSAAKEVASIKEKLETARTPSTTPTFNRRGRRQMKS